MGPSHLNGPKKILFTLIGFIVTRLERNRPRAELMIEFSVARGGSGPN